MYVPDSSLFALESCRDHPGSVPSSRRCPAAGTARPGSRATDDPTTGTACPRTSTKTDQGLGEAHHRRRPGPDEGPRGREGSAVFCPPPRAGDESFSFLRTTVMKFCLFWPAFWADDSLWLDDFPSGWFPLVEVLFPEKKMKRAFYIPSKSFLWRKKV